MSTKIQFSPSWKLWQFCAATVFATGTIVVAPIAAQAFSFTPLTNLNGSLFSISPKDVSADGSTVVGRVIKSNRQADMFRWTADTGMQLFSYTGKLMVQDYEVAQRDKITYATGISGDGSVIAGHVTGYAGNQATQQAFRWTESTGFTPLNPIPINPQYLSPANQSITNGISTDGTRIVGFNSRSWSEPHPASQWLNVLRQETVYWDGAAVANALPGQQSQQVSLMSISGDGQTLVGNIAQQAAIWNSAKGYTHIGNSGDSHATAASADGSIVVGYAPFGPLSSRGAFRWTEAEGLVSLGSLSSDHINSFAHDVSADGSVIVGDSMVTTNKHSCGRQKRECNRCRLC
jgi:uncharacterized membrane protein